MTMQVFIFAFLIVFNSVSQTAFAAATCLGANDEMTLKAVHEIIDSYECQNSGSLQSCRDNIVITAALATAAAAGGTAAVRAQMRLKTGDAVFFVAGRQDNFYKFAGLARNKVAAELKLVDEDQFAFCWIVDFPMYEWSEEEKKIDFSHNPFSMPNFDHEAFLKLSADDKDAILGMTAFQYDIVCNGVELSSGAIRNHKPEIMIKAFEIAGYGQEVVEDKFGGMLNAFRYGAPPHGGSAPGIDRIVMLLANVNNLRDVIAFPMNQQAQDLMMNAPSAVSPKQLRELSIRLAVPEAEKKT
jgi:aspartyl-tRNA synthetase